MKTRIAVAVVLLTAACGGDGPAAADADDRDPARPGGPAVDRLENDQIASLITLINGVEMSSARAVEPKLLLPAARELARTLIADHARLREAMPSFPGPAIPPPQAHGMNAVFRSQASMLSTLPSGTPFDATYAALQIADHAMAIDSLRRWHDVATDPDLRRAIARAVPVMQTHLAIARSVYAELDRGASPGPPDGAPPLVARPDTSRADTAPRPTPPPPPPDTTQ